MTGARVSHSRRTPRPLSTRLGRVFGGVLLALQALLWGGGQILEAKPAAAALMVVTHIEAPGDTGCPPLHRHVDCIVCRSFGSGAMAGSAARVPLPASAIAPAFSDQVRIASPQATVGSLGSRAPPTTAMAPESA